MTGLPILKKGLLFLGLLLPNLLMIRPRSVAAPLVCLFARRLVILGIVFIACPGAPHAGQGAAAPERRVLTPAQMEAFLLKARIVNCGTTVMTLALRVAPRWWTAPSHTMRKSRSVEIDRPVFDLWRYNIAGYRLAGLLGMDNVPMSIERKFEGKGAAVLVGR